MKTLTRSYPHKRKTVNVGELIDWTNDQLSRTDDYAQKIGFKAGIAHTLETILHYTNNYEGYRYLNNEDAGKIGSVGYYSRQYHKSRKLKTS